MKVDLILLKLSKPDDIELRLNNLTDREEVLQKASRKLKYTNFVVYEDTRKDLYDLEKSNN